MRLKKVHVKTKIFFKDPYVIKVIFNIHQADHISQFQSMVSSVRKSKGDTWGYIPPEMEVINPETFEFNLSSYWVFKDKMDAASFMLKYGDISTHIHMWRASLAFTIHEMTDEIVNSDPVTNDG